MALALCETRKELKAFRKSQVVQSRCRKTDGNLQEKEQTYGTEYVKQCYYYQHFTITERSKQKYIF